MTQPAPATLETQRLLRRALDAVEVGEPLASGSLTVWPLLGGQPEAAYDLLDAALAGGAARVTEVGGGSVPELRFVNDGDRPVLLADGEELIGAKQNRSLNLSILASARAATTIPVSCTEQGRWGYRDARADEPSPTEFRRGENVMSARARMSRERAVSASLRASAGAERRSDQHAVWDEIDGLAAMLDAPSETRALDDAFTRYREELGEYVRALALPEGACGAVFAIAAGPQGVDLFDAQSTFAALYPKILRSWSLDAIAAARRGRRRGARANPRLILDRLARRRCRVYPAAGLGVDARIAVRGSRLHGAALVADRVIHLAAFYERAA